MATDNVGVELLAATPFRHRVGLGPTGDIATVHHLPPTLMAQWYFGDASSKVRPYIGAGVNYTTFFDEKFNDTGKEAGLTDLSLKDSWGMAGQVGLDYLINRDWLINASVWYMDIDTDVRFKRAVSSKVSASWIRGCLCSLRVIVSDPVKLATGWPVCFAHFKTTDKPAAHQVLRSASGSFPHHISRQEWKRISPLANGIISVSPARLCPAPVSKWPRHRS
jgi:hypothetical protein